MTLTIAPPRPETVTLEDPPEVSPETYLRHAARYIEEHGWTQGALQEKDGRVCLHGAIFKVLSPNREDLESAILRRRAYLGTMRLLDSRIPQVGPYFSSLAWNDTPGRTVDEVLSVLRGKGDDG